MRLTYSVTRRGQAEMLPWMVRLGLMLVAVVVIVMLVRVYTDRDADSAQLHRAAYLYRIYYGDVIMRSDRITGRIYPGTVDVEKFTSSRLDEIFQEKGGRDSSKITSMMTLTLRDGCPFSISEPTIYNDKKSYDLYSAQTGLSGPGAATEERVVFPVNARKGSQECAAQLNITIVRPNS